MKHIKLLLLLLAVQCIATNGTAQVTRTFSAANTFVTVNNITVGISNLSITDSLGANNKMICTADFDITVTNSAETYTLLAMLQSSLENGKPLKLAITKANYNYLAVEERTYQGALIAKISLPEINAATKAAVKAKINIRSDNVSVVYDGNQKMNSTLGTKSTRAMADTYRFGLGALPTRKVTRIGALQVSPDGSSQQSFAVEVVATDARLWNEWFLTGGGGIKKEQGYIELLSPDLKEVILRIELADVEIVSYALNSSSQQTIQKSVIGLRTKRVVIKR